MSRMWMAASSVSHLPHQYMSAALARSSSCQGGASPPLVNAPSADRFLLPPVINVTARNKNPKLAPNAANKANSACSTGTPSGQ